MKLTTSFLLLCLLSGAAFTTGWLKAREIATETERTAFYFQRSTNAYWMWAFGPSEFERGILVGETHDERAQIFGACMNNSGTVYAIEKDGTIWCLARFMIPKSHPTILFMGNPAYEWQREALDAK